MSRPVRCINPQCPSLRTPNNGWFRNERALQIHLGHAPECLDHWAGVDSNTDQPFPPQLHAPSYSGHPPEPQHTNSELIDGEQMPEQPDNDDPPEPEFRVLDFPGAALRYAEQVGTEWEKRKELERPETRYGPFADAEEYGQNPMLTKIFRC